MSIQSVELQASAAVNDGSRVTDALVTWPGGQLAVEVDGPTHFIPDPTGGSGTVKSTATRLRDHQLAAWGVPVLSVEVTDVPVQHFSTAAFEVELTERLRGAGVPFAADSACAAPSTRMRSSSEP